MSDIQQLRSLLSQLVLSTPFESLVLPEEPSLNFDLLSVIAKGQPFKVLENEQVKAIIDLYKVGLYNDSASYNELVLKFATDLVSNSEKTTVLLIAVASLHMFIQNNFTGPQTPITSFEYFYSGSKVTEDQVQLNAVRALSAYGQTAYEEAEDPLFLLIALHILERLVLTRNSLLLNQFNSSEDFIDEQQVDVNDPITAAVNWWRSRAIQVQLSLFPEYSGPHITVSTSLLNDSLPKALGLCLDEKFQKDLSIIYYLERAKNALEDNLDHLALPNLIQAQKLTSFDFVLTGGRAKRTKYQTVAHSGLLVLARSNYFNNTTKENNQAPESFELNSDLLLERPVFENVGQEDIEEQIYKKQKTDNEGIDYQQLLPVSLRQEYIPQSLQSLDANAQPNLSDYDNIQLLLRLYAQRSISPSNDSLVDQQLMSLVSRVLYQADSSSVNYSIFSRGLWERSILETTKARTIERGILQMQSLVEEIGLKIKSRYIPAEPTNSEGQNSTTESNTRLRYIYQLPLLPRWSLDTKLAEKFMSLGIVKSAIEIYERLHLEVDVALCHAAIGEEARAKELITKRLKKFPEDARAISIMGDLTEDPSYWERAWEIGKYVKAKVALSKFNYYPPKGHERNTNAALSHMHDALTINPTSFDNWFFYGCVGLECSQFELAAEAFTRCVSLDDTNSNSWSNLATSLLKLDRTREALNALKKAVQTRDNKRSWRLWENYLIVAAKLGEWDDVLLACKKLVDTKKNSDGEGSIDIPVVEKLVEILVESNYDPENLTFFQKSCIEFTTITLPSVINSSSRLWRIISKVELWRQKPWAALECHEKAYRALSHNPDLEIDEKIWNENVEACDDLVAAYESLGELPGKHGAGDLVCKDWRYKAKSTVKSLMSKGKNSWEDSEGWDKLLELKKSL